MNSRVSTRDGKRLKEGGVIPPQRQRGGRSAQGCSHCCALWGVAGEEGLWITCKGVFISSGSMLALNSYQLLGKLQLRFKCIFSNSSSCFSSSKVCNLILSLVCIVFYQLIFSSSWLYVNAVFKWLILLPQYSLSKQKIHYIYHLMSICLEFLATSKCK